MLYLIVSCACLCKITIEVKENYIGLGKGGHICLKTNGASLKVHDSL